MVKNAIFGQVFWLKFHQNAQNISFLADFGKLTTNTPQSTPLQVSENSKVVLAKFGQKIKNGVKLYPTALQKLHDQLNASRTKSDQNWLFFFSPIATSPLKDWDQIWSRFCHKPYGWEVENFNFREISDNENSWILSFLVQKLPKLTKIWKFLLNFANFRLLALATDKILGF